MRQPTRRTALIYALALAAPTPVLALADPDPVYAAIECHRSAFAAFEAAPGDGTYSASYAALVALARVVPITLAGAVALFDHMHWMEEEDAGDYWDVLVDCDGRRGHGDEPSRGW